jgi:hypothetical protein
VYGRQRDKRTGQHAAKKEKKSTILGHVVTVGYCHVLLSTLVCLKTLIGYI